ncbi:MULTISPECIES: biopolymer transporter ExbD [unclassified Sphingomonas]|uniref:ExbD/TolR family protein n=1 Tax=Sphingomonas TaxID=13687 RepID=UPI00095A63A3|nr:MULTISPECIES: biopolymer transporter ExbD [unclassified Sphingomonas]MBN8810469.1 biopolymer transporter ExbD [Sphingomonas sp.]OJY50994.1 MAG: biopolymer transporter ExbD [Sphingomonas sp. 67-41]
MTRAVRARRIPDTAPIGAINITPLIDVMLVLLVVIIIAIPIASHKVPVDLPAGRGTPVPLPPAVLAIDRQGALHWNGAALADAALPERLAALQKSGAVLHLQTDPEARYERFDGILATVKRAGITRLGFVGNRPLED